MTDFDACAARALDTASARGAAYADIRFEEDRSERIEVRNGAVATLSDGTSAGYGIRALFDGAWGFAASADTSDVGIDRTAARAVEIARAGAAIATHRFGQAPTDRYVDTYATPFARDAAGVPLGERVALLLDAERALHAAPTIRVGRAWLDLWHTRKTFYSTTGSRIEQTLRQSGSGMMALAAAEGDAQDRSYPGDIGLYQAGGWEIVEAARLRENAQRIGEEASALLTNSRVVRSRGRTRSHHGMGSELLGNQLPRSGATRHAPIRIGPRDDRHR
jgi:TldD protein